MTRYCMECMFCGEGACGWYSYRWHGVYDGPVCQNCWQEDFQAPGYGATGGFNFPDETQPAFHIIRLERIKDLYKKNR